MFMRGLLLAITALTRLGWNTSLNPAMASALALAKTVTELPVPAIIVAKAGPAADTLETITTNLGARAIPIVMALHSAPFPAAKSHGFEALKG